MSSSAATSVGPESGSEATAAPDAAAAPTAPSSVVVVVSGTVVPVSAGWTSSSPHAATVAARATPATTTNARLAHRAIHVSFEYPVQFGEGVLDDLGDENGMHTHAAGSGDVPGMVIEEDRPIGRHAAQLLEGMAVDARIGLAHPDRRAVDHDVEQLVDRQHRPPAVGRLAHVVRDDRRPVAVGLQGSHPVDHRLLHA